jgi:hypothetical protein
MIIKPLFENSQRYSSIPKQATLLELDYAHPLKHSFQPRQELT